jgi:hypothetical protein
MAHAHSILNDVATILTEMDEGEGTLVRNLRDIIALMASQW